MNKNPIINYYLFISIWDSFPTGWNSFLFFSFFVEPSCCVVNCGWLLHFIFSCFSCGIILIWQFLALWNVYEWKFKKILSSRTNYMDKYKSELPLWQEFGTFKETCCPNTGFTSSWYILLPDAKNGIQNLSYFSRHVYIYPMTGKYIHNSVRQNVYLGLPRLTITTTGTVLLLFLFFSLDDLTF